MRHFFRGLKNPKTVVAMMMGALAASPFLSNTWVKAQSYCPGSPWNCVLSDTCSDITWCQDDPDNCGYWPSYNFGWGKTRIIKSCRIAGQSGITTYCASCGSAVQSACCTWVTSAATCPEGTNCN